MTDYNLTRTVAGTITDRFSNMLRDLEDDYEDEIVVVSLMKAYEMNCKPDKVDNTIDEYIDPDEDLLWAIELLLQYYMPPADFKNWKLRLKDKGECDGHNT